MIIDVHTHVPLRRDDWPEYVASSLRNGVAATMVSALGVEDWPQYPDSGTVRRSNDLARQFSAYCAGLAHWLAYLNPQNSDWCDELQRCVDAGAVGVKLWISVKNVRGELDAALAVLRAAAARGLPVLIHSFNRDERYLPGEVNTEEIALLARKCPETRIIEAHAGSNWRFGLDPIRDLHNVSVDISGYYPQRGMVEQIVDEIGAGRVLYGSDMFGREQASQLAKVLLANIPTAEKRQILWGNTQELFGLSRPAGAAPVLSPQVSVVGDTSIPAGDEDHFCFCGAGPLPRMNKDAAELSAQLSRVGIRRGFTCSAAALIGTGLEKANQELLDAAQDHANIAPLAAVNPARYCRQRVLQQGRQGFAGVFVSPWLHGWALDDPGHRAFFERCAKDRLPVWVNCDLHDFRFFPPEVSYRPVTRSALEGFIAAAPPNRYVFQGLKVDEVKTVLAGARRHDLSVQCEISRLTDYTGYLAEIVRTFGTDRLLYGSEYPLREMATVRWTARQILADTEPAPAAKRRRRPTVTRPQ